MTDGPSFDLLQLISRYVPSGCRMVQHHCLSFVATLSHALPLRFVGQRVYGTDRYALNSYVCLATVHAGRLTAEGGFVTVQSAPIRISPALFLRINLRRIATSCPGETMPVARTYDYALPDSRF